MTRPLSIALVRQRYASDGGAERFVARALDTLKGRGIKVTLITREWVAIDGIEVIKVNPFYLGRVWRDWSFARSVCRIFKARHFDLVQSHERISCCDIYRAGDGVHREWLAQLKRVRGPLGRLGLALNPYHHYVKWAEKRLFNSPQLKAVICNSEMVKREIRHYFGVPDEKLRVIYSGVDTETYHPRLAGARAEVRARHRIPDRAPLLLFVGSGFERKGVATAIQALASTTTGAYLLIVGRDKRAEGYRRQTRKLGVADRVLFVGAQMDVKPYYGAADALVLPTRYDPFPNVVLEALASGLPVITSTTSGAAEILENGVDGYVCDALDSRSLAAAMDRIASSAGNDREAARRKGEAFTLSRMTAELRALYDELGAARRAGL